MEHLSKIACQEFGHNLADTCKFFGFAMNLVEENLKECPKVRREKNRFLPDFQVVFVKQNINCGGWLLFFYSEPII